MCKIYCRSRRGRYRFVTCSANIDNGCYNHCAGLLMTSLLHNSQQLSGWCQHFISSNYSVFEHKEDFVHIPEETMEEIAENRWPPISYLNAIDEYQKKYGSDDQQLEEATSDKGRNTRKTTERCCVM